MNRLLCAVAAIALMAPTIGAAQAQNQGHHSNRGEQRPHAQRAQRPQNRPSRPTLQRPQNRPNRPTAQRPSNRPARPSQPARPNRPSIPSTRPTARPQPVFRPGHRPSTYHRVRARAFRYPHGYHYRRWSIGVILPRLFLSNSYYWNDWGALGLGPPPPGYVWVRYGPDLLLVNRFTGRIADVIYGAFY